MRYVVAGTRRVAGHEPGSVVSADDLADAPVDHLVAVGHLTVATVAKKAPVTVPETSEED